jgi:hypothetical protein
MCVDGLVVHCVSADWSMYDISTAELQIERCDED